MRKNITFRPLANIATEDLQQEARFLGLGVRSFTAAAGTFLTLLFFLKSFAERRWVIPALYPLLREFIMWPLDFYGYICYVVLLTAGYLAIVKRYRMKAAQTELDLRRKEHEGSEKK